MLEKSGKLTILFHYAPHWTANRTFKRCDYHEEEFNWKSAISGCKIPPKSEITSEKATAGPAVLAERRNQKPERLKVKKYGDSSKASNGGKRTLFED